MSTRGNADDSMEWIIGVPLGIAAIFLLVMAATVGGIIVGVIALAWFLWKRYQRSDAVRLRREIGEIEKLHSAASYAAAQFKDMPSPVEFAETTVAVMQGRAEKHDVGVAPSILPRLHDIAEELYINAGYGPLAPFDRERLSDPDIRNEIRARLTQQKRLFEQRMDGLDKLLSSIMLTFLEYLDDLPQTGTSAVFEPGDASGVLNVATLDMLGNPKNVIQRCLLSGFDDDDRPVASLEPLKDFARRKLARSTGIPLHEVQRSDKLVMPTDDPGTPSEVAHKYLSGSPFLKLFEDRLRFVLPEEARFEHTHIIAGTGHGKTQLFQLLIRQDIERALEMKRSVVVIDGQGDLINTIAHLPCFAPGAPLADRIVIVDPTDMEHPAALNMFDAGQDGFRELSLSNREMILNGTVELYSYLFGALLGAELTQKQEVIFRYLARLMLVIPGATIEILRELMEDGEKYRPFVERLTGSSRAFFETQFFDRHFDDTKKQILRRLWGVLSNEALAQMFNHPRNKVDVYEAINDGKVVLINTAKDLLKTEGSAIFGRFFIAMTAQAAIRRAVVPRSERTPTMVYIDEAHEYIDDRVEDLLNQARKFKVAMHLAHQNLGQLTPAQRATLASSTSIKMMGGASANDAKTYAPEMRTTGEEIAATKKRSGGSEFMVHIRNVTESAVKANVPFGAMERMGRMENDDYRALRAANRERYCAPREVWRPSSGLTNAAPRPAESTKPKTQTKPPEPDDHGFDLGEHEPL